MLGVIESFLDLRCLLEHTNIIAVTKFLLLLLEEFGADVCLCIQLFRLQLHIDEVCIL